MAGDVPVKRSLPPPANPCCALWKEKFSKVDAGRKHLRQAVQILTEQVDKIQAQNVALQKAYDEEKVQADTEKLEKEKDLAARVSLENEISALKAEITSLKQKGTAGVKDKKEEVKHLQDNVSRAENEIAKLKALFEKEKMRAESEKKNAEAHKKSASEAWKLMNAEKAKVNEERKLAFSERKNAEEYRLQLERLRKEIEEVNSKLGSERLIFAEADKKLDAEKSKVAKERKRADLEMAKAEEQMRLAEANEKKFVEEKSRADILCQDLEDAMRKIEELQKEINEFAPLRNLVSTYQHDKDEILALSSEFSSQRKQSSDIEGKTTEAKLFENRVSEGEKQIIHLKVLLEKEKEKVDHLKKNAEDERKNAAEAWKCVEVEKAEANEEKKNADIEREKAKGYKVQLEALRKEANQTKTKLASEILRLEKAVKELEREKHKKHKKATEIFEGKNQKMLAEGKHTDIGLLVAEEQRKVVEVNMKMALEEKSRADQLACQLEDSRHKIDALQKQIHELMSFRKAVEASTRLLEKNEKSETRNLKLLEKQLKLEKMRLKHAKQVTKLEKSRNKILQNELNRIKLDSVLISQRLGALDRWLSSGVECTKDVEKLSNIRRPKSKRKLCDLEPFPMRAETESELFKSSYMAMPSSYPDGKQNYCSAPLLLSSGGYSIPPISGIDSKLKSLDGGSSQKLLKSFPMNSSSASFSDGQLTGSQERGAFHSSTSEKRVAVNSGRTNSCMSCEVTKKHCNENLAVVAENSVRTPNSIDALEKGNGCAGKLGSMPDAIESVEILYSEGKKLHMQMEEKLYVLHGMLNRNMDKPVEEPKYMEATQQGALYAKHEGGHKKRKTACDRKTILKNPYGIGEQENTKQKRNDIHIDGDAGRLALPSSTYLLGTPQCCTKGLGDSFGSDSETMEIMHGIENGDYMKLLDLDNFAEEECYRRAMEMPLSPSLPEIDISRIEVVDADKFAVHNNLIRGLLNDKEDLFPSHSFDVIDAEINSNNLSCNASGMHCNKILHKNEGPVDSFDMSENGNDHCNTMDGKGNSDRWTKDSELLELPKTTNYGMEGIRTLNVLSKSKLGSIHANLPAYCVVFSNTHDSGSVSRIFQATRTCMIRCSLDMENEGIVQKILRALKMEDKISLKEKACALFTLMLLNFSSCISVNSGSFLDKNSFQCLNPSACQINAVISDVEARKLCAELDCWDELVAAITDFLINGQLMVHADASSQTSTGSDSRMTIFVDGINIDLSSKPASSGQLVAGSVIFASLCAAMDHIELICEASYKLLQIRKYDNGSLLTILHVFAQLGGKELFSLKEYSLTMTVLRSIVALLERECSSVSSASCISPLHGVTNKFCTCAQCPFDTISVDTVISLLLEKLCTYGLLVPVQQQLMASANLSNLDTLCHTDNAKQGSSYEQIFAQDDENCGAYRGLDNSVMHSSHSNSIYNGNLADLYNVLSLVELVACYMNWEWICGKVIPVLLETLERPIVDDYAVVVILLLGQLGRFGVVARGCEDKEVESLKSKLSGFLRQNATIRAFLPAQIATITSLLGLLCLDIKDVVRSDMQLPKLSSQSVHIDAIRNWFSVLSKEQQNLSYSLLHSTAMDAC